MVIRKIERIVLTISLTLLSLSLHAQEKQEIFDFMTSDDYIVGGVSVSGIRFLDTNALIGISGIRVGQEITIPGDALKMAVQKLWLQGLFSDVRISIAKVVSDSVYLDIFLQERPRISSVKYNGLKKSEQDDLVPKLNLPVGSQVTEFLTTNAAKIIKDHFIEKGFLNTSVDFVEKDDPDRPNNVILSVNVNKNEKVKIANITFVGNEYFQASKLRKQFKGTKVKNANFFRASKFIDTKYEEDKLKLKTFYNDNGFKDFTIISDSLYKVSEERVGLTIKVEEGTQYYLRDVDWVGNSVYPKEKLVYHRIRLYL